jgi:hypothetical protein
MQLPPLCRGGKSWSSRKTLQHNLWCVSVQRPFRALAFFRQCHESLATFCNASSCGFHYRNAGRWKVRKQVKVHSLASQPKLESIEKEENRSTESFKAEATIQAPVVTLRTKNVLCATKIYRISLIWYESLISCNNSCLLFSF